LDEETAFIGTNVTQSVKEKAEARAKQLGLNMSNYLRFLVMKDLEK
jgi:antitoxin component of RelBE/YafQ-DinJ toxin-antitoxin module